MASTSTGIDFSEAADSLSENGESLAAQPIGFRGTIGAADERSIPMRLRELGFVPGTEVAILRRGPLGDPIELELRGYRICLRREDLDSVVVVHPSR